MSRLWASLSRCRQVTTCCFRLFGLLLITAAGAPGQSGVIAPTAAQDSASPAAPAVGRPDRLTNQPSAATVSLELIAHTKKNKPVPDLRPSDLAVIDNGSPVTLTDLHLVSEGSASDHLITFLFDRLNPSSAGAARRAAARMLSAVPENGYSIAVYQMANRLRLIQAFTTDRSVVSSAVVAATSGLDHPGHGDLTPAEKALFTTLQSNSLSVDSRQRARAALVRTSLENAQHLLEDQHVHPSVAAVRAIAQSERGIPGRKFVFWFSEGMRGDSGAADAVRSTVAEANRDGLTICAVDTSSVDESASSQIQSTLAASVLAVGAPVSGHSSGRSIGGTASSGNFAPGEQLTADVARSTMALQFGALDAGHSPLERLATETGGIYLRASSVSKRQLHQFQSDLTSYYQLSFTAPAEPSRDTYHPVSVRALRRKVVVRTRSGYFAGPSGEYAEMLPWEAPLFQILASDPLPAAIRFRTSLLHMGPLPDGNTTELSVEVPLSELQFREDANTHISSAHASILAVIKDNKGAVLRHFSRDSPLHESPDLLRRDSGGTLTLQDHFTAEPGVYTLEAVVFDAIGNRIGAQRHSFTIGPCPVGPSLSDLILVRSVEPMHDPAAFDPASYQGLRIVPRIDSDLPEGTRTLSLFFLSHLIPGSMNQPRLQLQISRNDEILSMLPIALSPASGTGGAVSWYGNIGAAAFPPGRYQAKAILTQDDRTDTSTLTFSVQGTLTASTAPVNSFAATPDTPDLQTDRQRASSDALRNSAFVLASPSDPAPAPSAADVAAIIEAARQSALSWFDSLENFFCVEVTSHSVDPTDSGDWIRKDTVVELIRYIDHQESRTTLRHNGEPSSIPGHQLGFAWSAGEFGGIFHILFDPSARASFSWKESDILDGQPVQVFSFQVAPANSTFNLADRSGRQSRVGFHGLLYLETTTHSPRRITIEADDIPATLAIRASTVSVDYAWITLNHHDYLLPVRGAVRLREGKHAPVLNEFQFSDYRRFGSQVRILNRDSEPPQQD
jgi:VWFA-related protein